MMQPLRQPLNLKRLHHRALADGCRDYAVKLEGQANCIGLTADQRKSLLDLASAYRLDAWTHERRAYVR